MAVQWVVFRIRDDVQRPNVFRVGEYWAGWRAAAEELGTLDARDLDEATRRAQDRFPGVCLFCQSVTSLVTDGYRSSRIDDNARIP